MAGVSVQAPRRPRTQAADWLEIARPFSWTVGLGGVVVGTAAAALSARLDAGRFLLGMLAILFLQSGLNIVNEVFDVRNGVDTLETPRASRVLVEGRLDARAAYRAGVGCLLAAVALGAIFAWGLGLGPAPFWIGVLGALGGYFYTAPPVQFKYRALGVAVGFFFMGPLDVLAAQYVQVGAFTAAGLWASLPMGLLGSLILHANELRDADGDASAGIRTLSTLLGPSGASRFFDAMLVLIYGCVAAAVAARALPWPALLTLLTLPMALGCVRRIRGSDLARIDLETAKLQFVFGLLLTSGLLAAALA
jgi:1,4-dihydroxy-2-naphthoate octaprenyltransferase